MNEFDLIAQVFAPLASAHVGALSLKDDAALIDVPAGQQLVITKDALIAGVHFMGSESPDAIAHKALAVNLSDLAAMGATPQGYLLALMLPETCTQQWLIEFAQGLQVMQETYGAALLGGDTTRTPGPLALSVTALGAVPQGKALLRSGARVGDAIYVSGTIGDGALGLRVAQGQLAENAFLRQRYERPTPRVALGQALRGIAHACMDVSDGLLQDLGHICTASGVGAVVQWNTMPLSDAAKTVTSPLKDAHEIIMAGGDDYELLFTAPPEASTKIAALSKQLALPLAQIGVITEDKHVSVVDANNAPLAFSRTGYQHF